MIAGNNLELIYNRYIRDLSVYATYLGADKEIAMDAIQDIFCKLSAKNEPFSNIQSIKLYLFKSLKNRIYDIYRAKQEHISLDAVDTSSEPVFNIRLTIEDKLICDEEQAKIKNAVAEILGILSDRQREIVYLRYVQEYSYEEIAELLGISVNSCRKYLSKAMQTLKKEYGQQILLILLVLLPNC